MLKLRAMGTKNDLKWFKKIIERYDVFHVIRMSEPLTMQGSNKYYRMYIELDHIPQKALARKRKGKHKHTDGGKTNVQSNSSQLLKGRRRKDNDNL